MSDYSILTAESKLRKFGCSYCHKDITLTLKIHCAECDGFTLCSDCFSVGVNLGNHCASHGYRIADCLDCPIFAKDWSISEELLLLEGIDRHGAGNWKTISENLLSGKTVRQIEEHYWELYMGTHGYCLPQKTILADKSVDTASFFPEANADPDSSSSFPPSSSSATLEDSSTFGMRIAVTEGYSLNEIVRRDVGKELKNKEKDKQEIREKLALLPGSDLPGFIPLREDFDVEYDNDAEQMLADMEFLPLEDHPSERELKLQVIRIYNNRLQERDARKRFVIDRGLIDFKQQQMQDKRRSKEERDLVGKLRMFARFHSAAEHDALVEGVLRARRLRQQIDLYKQYRSMGIRSLEQARQYEMDKRAKEREAKLSKQKQREGYTLGTGGAVSAGVTGKDVPVGYNPDDFASESGRNNAAYVALTGGGAGADEYVGLSGAKRRSSRGLDEIDGGGGGGRPPRGSSSSSSGGAAGKMARAGSSSELDGAGGGVENAPIVGGGVVGGGVVGGGGGGGGGGLKYQQLPPSMPGFSVLELSAAPGANLLSDMELSLCSRVPMMPLHYLAAKDAVVREAFRNGALREDGMKRIFNLNETKLSQIYDFFVKEMMINETAAAMQSSVGTAATGGSSISKKK